MKHRLLMTAIASIMLTGAIGVTTQVKPVQAITYTGSKSNKKKIINQGYYTECLLDKNVKLAKIHWRHPLYKSKLSFGYWAAKHTIAYIKKSGFNYVWYLKTSRHAKTTYTVLKRPGDYSWFELW